MISYYQVVYKKITLMFTNIYLQINIDFYKYILRNVKKNQIEWKEQTYAYFGLIKLRKIVSSIYRNCFNSIWIFITKIYVKVR